jgi:hypothetical protein
MKRKKQKEKKKKMMHESADEPLHVHKIKTYSRLTRAAAEADDKKGLDPLKEFSFSDSIKYLDYPDCIMALQLLLKMNQNQNQDDNVYMMNAFLQFPLRFALTALCAGWLTGSMILNNYTADVKHKTTEVLRFVSDENNDFRGVSDVQNRLLDLQDSVDCCLALQNSIQLAFLIQRDPRTKFEQQVNLTCIQSALDAGRVLLAKFKL